MNKTIYLMLIGILVISVFSGCIKEQKSEEEVNEIVTEKVTHMFENWEYISIYIGIFSEEENIEVIEVTSTDIVRFEDILEIDISRGWVGMGGTSFIVQIYIFDKPQVYGSGYRWCKVTGFGVGKENVERYREKMNPHLPYIEQIIDRVDSEIYTLRVQSEIVDSTFYYERWYFYKENEIWKRIVIFGTMSVSYISPIHEWNPKFYSYSYDPKDTNNTNSTGDSDES